MRTKYARRHMAREKAVDYHFQGPAHQGPVPRTAAKARSNLLLMGPHSCKRVFNVLVVHPKASFGQIQACAGFERRTGP